MNLVSAFNDKSKRVKKQALPEVNIGGHKVRPSGIVVSTTSY